MSRAWAAFTSKPWVQKLGVYWKQLYTDYRDVALDTYRDGKAHPRKFLAIFAGFGVLGTAFHTNPNEQDFRGEVVTAVSRIASTSIDTRNPAADDYLRFLYRGYNENTIRYVNLGFLSLIWRDNYDPGTDLYKAQCPLLKPRVLEILRERVLDVGMFGEWFYMNRAMIDYDVNPALYPGEA